MLSLSLSLICKHPRNKQYNVDMNLSHLLVLLHFLLVLLLQRLIYSQKPKAYLLTCLLHIAPFWYAAAAPSQQPNQSIHTPFFFTLPIAENQAPLLVVLLHKKLAAAELDLLPTSPTQLLLCFSLFFFPSLSLIHSLLLHFFSKEKDKE
jgi:hypothetical protein